MTEQMQKADDNIIINGYKSLRCRGNSCRSVRVNVAQVKGTFSISRN